jgi:Cellulase (glycosyl hydrolase family 5)
MISARAGAAGALSRIAGCSGRPFLCLAIALSLLAWLAPLGHAELPTGAQEARARQSATAPLGGVNISAITSSSRLAGADREIAVASALHSKVVRVELPWSVFEPRGPNQIDPRALAYTDRLMSDAASAGIGVIAMVESSPCWASSAPASLLRACAPTGSSQANAWPPRSPSTFAAFVSYLAQRYGSSLKAIEVWNEPDQSNQRYFAGPEKPQRYAAILRAAYTAIKQANQHVLVLGGSLVGSNGAFLRALYAAGIKGYYDGLSVHFYSLVLASLRAIHEVQLANGDSKPLWLNEFGWTSCWPRRSTQQEQACVTPAVQAANISDTLHSLAGTPYIAAEVLYGLQDSASEDFGVLTGAGARKPAFAALSKALAAPFASARRVTLKLSRHGGRVLASGSGPVGDYMELEASQGAVLRYRALFILNRFNRYSITLPRVLGTSGLRLRVYQYWAGPARGAQKTI